jgi:hypothetical protein
MPPASRDEHVDLARTIPDVRSTSPGRPKALHSRSEAARQTPTEPRLRPTTRSSEPPYLPVEASIVVDPTLAKDASPPPEASTYEPLPADPAEYAKWARERSAARSLSGARLHWNQQETQLIPRDSLAPPLDPKLRRRRILAWSSAALFLLTAIGGGVYAKLRGSAATAKVATNTSTSAALHGTVGRTVIATEPSGAELLQFGAVLGNTPLEISRPKQGEALYVVRLHGFVSELVRVTADSKPAIHVSLTPTNPATAGQ